MYNNKARGLCQPLLSKTAIPQALTPNARSKADTTLPFRWLRTLGAPYFAPAVAILAISGSHINDTQIRDVQPSTLDAIVRNFKKPDARTAKEVTIRNVNFVSFAPPNISLKVPPDTIVSDLIAGTKSPASVGQGTVESILWMAVFPASDPKHIAFMRELKQSKSRDKVIAGRWMGKYRCFVKNGKVQFEFALYTKEEFMWLSIWWQESKSEDEKIAKKLLDHIIFTARLKQSG